MNALSTKPTRYGVVAVMFRHGRMLVIRRSQTVIAPGTLCFPGGGIERGESEEDALRRELREELALAVNPVRRLWCSLTSWNVHLAWWHCNLARDIAPCPNPKEVESVGWYRLAELRALPNLLASNGEFLDALGRQEIRPLLHCCPAETRRL
jgi:8-oxo-dGTP pyrophosphatase MutT (NUDIX family)